MVTNGAKEVIMAVAEINLEEFPEAKCGQVEYDQALYSVNERLNTFKDSHWPFDSGPCVPLKVLSTLSVRCMMASCRARIYW